MKKQLLLGFTIVLWIFSVTSHAGGQAAIVSDVDNCQGYGPQTPRDIDSRTGTNSRVFSLAPPYQQLNLCNIHFHNNAEHKANDFSIIAAEGAKGVGAGYLCGIGKQLTAAELAPTKSEICQGMKPGDTIEVHWVHSSCAVTPGQGLGSCLSASCANPDLRVEAQVFTLVNDTTALDFSGMTYDRNVENGLHQAKALPIGTGVPVQFTGSTTGPNYTQQACSPMQVSWSVRPQCAKLNINSLGEWCQANVFKENHAHGVRKLVTDPRLLSEIQK